jgi:hypothetical protein
MPTHSKVAGFYAIQSVSGLTWWIAVASSPRIHDWFSAVPSERAVLMSFLPVDVVLWVGGGLLTSRFVVQNNRWAIHAMVSMAVLSVYIAGYLFVLSISTGQGWPTVVAMSMSAGLSVILAWLTASRS